MCACVCDVYLKTQSSALSKMSFPGHKSSHTSDIKVKVKLLSASGADSVFKCFTLVSLFFSNSRKNKFLNKPKEEREKKTRHGRL